MTTPVHSFDRVAHIGTWPNAPAARSPRSGASYEGIGLSVSQHPEAWEHIAKLGGFPTRWLVRRDGKPGQFVDGHVVHAPALAWARSQGWIVDRPAWEVCWEDDELERQVCFQLLDYAEALEEAAERAESEPRQISLPLPAGKLLKRLNDFYGPQRDDQHPAFEGELVNRWVATQHPEFDGVWWDNILDPVTLTAPAGLILPERLSAWRVQA